MIKWMLIILILAILGGFFFQWFFNQPCEPPERPPNIPISAKWSGSCDGGVWIDLVTIKGEKYRFRIYQDWSGELLMDSDFEFEKEQYNLNKDNWSELVCCYTHSLEQKVELSANLKGQEKEMTYRLSSVYPAYGGSDWEIIKQKYDL